MNDKTIAASIVLLSGCVLFGAGLIGNTPLGFLVGLAVMLVGASLTHRSWTGRTISERFAQKIKDALDPGSGSEPDPEGDDESPEL